MHLQEVVRNPFFHLIGFKKLHHLFLDFGLDTLAHFHCDIGPYVANDVSLVNKTPGLLQPNHKRRAVVEPDMSPYAKRSKQQADGSTETDRVAMCQGDHQRAGLVLNDRGQRLGLDCVGQPENAHQLGTSPPNFSMQGGAVKRSTHKTGSLDANHSSRPSGYINIGHSDNSRHPLAFGQVEESEASIDDRSVSIERLLASIIASYKSEIDLDRMRPNASRVADDELVQTTMAALFDTGLEEETSLAGDGQTKRLEVMRGLHHEQHQGKTMNNHSSSTTQFAAATLENQVGGAIKQALQSQQLQHDQRLQVKSLLLPLHA